MSGVESTRIGSDRKCAGVISSVTFTDLENFKPTASCRASLMSTLPSRGRYQAHFLYSAVILPPLTLPSPPPGASDQTIPPPSERERARARWAPYGLATTHPASR